MEKDIKKKDTKKKIVTSKLTTQTLTINNINTLIDVKEKDFPLFTLKGLETLAKITKVYDGDTCHAYFIYSGNLVKKSIRMLGYDTPEMRSKTEYEKHLAIKAKEYLSSLVLDKIVRIICHREEKYGRPLVDMYIADENYVPDAESLLITGWAKTFNISISDLMLASSEKFAYKYFGGKKEKWVAPQVIESSKEVKLSDKEKLSNETNNNIEKISKKIEEIKIEKDK